MIAVKGTQVQNLAATRALIVVLAILIVVQWRIVLKMVLLILAVAFIALLGTGAYEVLHHVHHAVR